MYLFLLGYVVVGLAVVELLCLMVGEVTCGGWVIWVPLLSVRLDRVSNLLEVGRGEARIEDGRRSLLGKAQLEWIP